MSDSRHIARLMLALALASMLAACSPQIQTGAAPNANTALASTPGQLPAFKHIFEIVMENKDYEEIIGNAHMPYINGLAKQYGLATNYYGIRHPSLPNYMALTGGSTFGISSDCNDCFVDAPNLADQIEASGRSWKAYIESMPEPCFLGDSPPLYRQKHNPFIYYNSVRKDPARCGKTVPLTQLDSDLRAHALPDFVWITPNMCDDSHDCGSDVGDTWLSTWVPKILESPEWRDGGVLFITYDEGYSKKLVSRSCCVEGKGGHVATLVLSPLGKPGYQSAIGYDHYSLLRTIEDAWGMPELGGASCACAPPMSDFFAEPAAASPRSAGVPPRTTRAF